MFEGKIQYTEEEWKLACQMHTAYEGFAIEEGWNTQKSCQVKPLGQCPEKNQRVMIKMARMILAMFK